MSRQYHDISGDPLADTGVWGPPTSHANFCEEDYAVTRYIAEFFNTLTNLAYVYYALRSPSAPGKQGPILGLDLAAASLVLVGVFSLVFHATLLAQTQFLDEMSMFLLGAALLQPLYTTGRPRAARRAVTAALASVLVAVSAVYYRTRFVPLHWGAFFVVENMIWPRAFAVIRRAPPAAQPRLRREFWTATGVMALALAVWTVDLGLCPPLRALRERLGMPWGVLLELHGWWHILTAVAASKYIKLVREICP